MKFRVKGLGPKIDNSKKRDRLYFSQIRSKRDSSHPPSFSFEEEVYVERRRKFNLKKYFKKAASWATSIFLSFLVALMINIYVLRPSKVSGESMVPTLKDKDVVYISRLPYIFGHVKFGDIVVINSNLEAKRDFFSLIAETLKSNIITKDLFDYEVDTFWIKRVIGVEGDIIEFKDDSIYRNGEKLEEDYLNSQNIYTYPNGVKITVKEGYIYVMGDNRNVSRDSRHEDQIPVKNVIGKLVF